jgi:hypothetical protein
MYIILVSSSGVGKKSTCIDQGMELIDLSGIDIDVLRGKITPTRLVSRLHSSLLTNADGYAELMVFAREFKVFAKGVTRDSSLIEDLTDLYDCKVFEYETEHSLRHQIKKPCLNILGASTPEWLSAHGGADLMSGGFGARMIPVCLEKSLRLVAWPEKTTNEITLQQGLLADLVEISKMTGAFYVTPEARKTFQDWYERGNDGREKDNRLDGYYSKKHDMVLKVAMCLAASKNSDMAITAMEVEVAVGLLTSLEENMLFAYSGGSGDSGPRALSDRILQYLKEKGSATKTDLTKAFHYRIQKAEELKEAVDTLIQAELIKAEKREAPNGKGMKPTWWFHYLPDKKEIKNGS